MEEEPPERLPDDEVTIIDIYGSVFYADADAIDAQLPETRGTRHAVLVVRLRGRGELGSSAIGLLRRWAQQLQEGGGALLLAGVGRTHGRPARAHRHHGRCSGRTSIFPAHSLVYQSTEEAFEVGRRRLHRDPESPGDIRRIDGHL